MNAVGRRALCLGLAALPFAPALAAEPFAIDWQGAPIDPELAARLAQQVAAIRALPIDPAIIDFFGRQPVFVHPRAGMPSVTVRRGVFITRDPFPVDNPVLLHEYCHRYQGQRIEPVPAKQRQLLAFYDRARATPAWPAQAYMYSNDHEFFAMTASCTLFGRTARPPYTRAALRRALPDLSSWIAAEFSFRG